jgi:hypothetical protein
LITTHADLDATPMSMSISSHPDTAPTPDGPLILAGQDLTDPWGFGVV